MLMSRYNSMVLMHVHRPYDLYIAFMKNVTLFVIPRMSAILLVTLYLYRECIFLKNITLHTKLISP